MKYILLFLFLSVAATASAQKYTVTPIGEISGSSADNNSDAIYYHGKLYTIDVDSKLKFAYTANLENVNYSFALNQYDLAGNLLHANKMDEGKVGFGPLLPGYVILNDKLYLQYYTYHKEEGMKIHLSTVDAETGIALTVAPLLTIPQKRIGIFKMLALVNSYNLDVDQSPDGSKFLFCFSTGLNNDFAYTVTDKNLKVEQTGSEEIPDSKLVIVNNSIVTNKGDFYISFRNKLIFSKKFFLVQGGSGKQIKTLEFAAGGNKDH